MSVTGQPWQSRDRSTLVNQVRVRDWSLGAVTMVLVRLKWWLPAAVVGLVAIAVYAHTLGFEFVYDDVHVVVHNERIHSLANWREILLGPWWTTGLYRPFTSLTLALEWAAGGGSPYLFHLGNVAAHAGASVLVLMLAGTLLPRPAALAAGLVFAVHPVHVEAVANIVGRAEVLATMFTLVGALLYRAHGDPVPRSSGRRTALGLGALAAILLALASKESAFAAPALLLLMDWAAARAEGVSPAQRFGRHWRLWAAAVVVTATWLALRTRILGELAGSPPAPGLAGTGPSERLVLMLPVIPEYLRLFFFPARLSADYSPDFLSLSTTFSLRSVAGLALLAGVAVVAIAAHRRAPAVTFALAWIAAALFVVCNVLVPSGILLAERTLYLASVGACLVLAWLWGRLLERHRTVAWTVLILVVGAGAARTWTRALVWRDNTTFFPQLVRDAPGSFRSDWVAGMLAYMAGDSARGELLMRRGLKTYSGNGAMWSDFARVMERQRRWREAADYHWAAFTADRQLESEAARAVAAYVQAGAVDTAQARLAAAEQLLRPFQDLTISASHVALARGDAARATELRAVVARERGDDYRLWLITGQAAVRARDCAVLAESVDRIRALRPALPPLAALRDSLVGLGCP